MDAGQLSGWAAAGVSAASAVGSLIGWWRSRAAKNEAAEQALIATEAQVSAADALKQIADAGTARQETQAKRSAAEEIEPWAVDPVPGSGMACYLRNKTGVPKYGISVAGKFVNHPNSFDFIGPRDHKQFGVTTNINAPVSVEVTWHLREDRTDTLPPQTISIP
jgi:hypothetical protein